jgi:hypothetical protein
MLDACAEPSARPLVHDRNSGLRGLFPSNKRLLATTSGGYPILAVLTGIFACFIGEKRLAWAYFGQYRA